jgi:hypothetical protein
MNHTNSLDFKEFSSNLKTNQRYSLLLFLFREIGLDMYTEDKSLVFAVTDADKGNNFFTWLKDKEEYFNSKKTAKVDTI